MKKLLLVIDYQKDFVDGSLGFEKAKHIDSNIANKIDEYRKENNDVIFTFDTHYEDYLNTMEGKLLPIPHCIKGSEGHKLYGLTAKKLLPSDLIFEKEVFGSKELGKYLENNFYDEIELVGIVSNICVISNAIIARSFSKESKIIVDANCVASMDDEMNKKVLDVMEGLQISVINK